ncbi:MAG: AMP-binding protein, partial [Proteobacteria bacterium]|nr:AMP-binding protein [Pseudomonadota bacterium]
PLANGITTFMFGGTPTYPTPARFWQLIDKYKVNVLYTAPTAIRALKKEGDEWLDKSTRGSLRLLGSVGEPINPEAWHWYYEKVGFSKSPIVDTWWQTETGAVMICPNGKENEAKPGAACKPLPGIYPVLLDEQDNEIEGEASGFLAIKYPWPSLARTIATNHERYLKAYFKNGYYITGDGARRDKDGDYWITGRIDDVLNVSGHRLGTAEIESALAKHKSVAEVAVVGIPHPIKGQGIHAFICLKDKTLDKAHLQEELLVKVSQTIGALAKPDVIQWVEDLPKTRSGKIMRRILRLFAENKIEQLSDLGDLSTLANPLSIEGLMKKEKPN